QALGSARSRGGTLNDLLLTAVSAAADAYHAERDTELDRLQATFIISTRDESTGIGNAFSPSPVELPGAGLDLDERFVLIAGRAEQAKEGGTERSELQAALAGPARFVPASALAAFGRRQARRVDIATSNLRSAPARLWVGGAPARYNVPIGPVAGTACNITLMSYADRADLGLHLDPRAIEAPGAFRDHVEAALEGLL
ncbi:MAG: WS/DGAT domain-containing protein, partial [Actinomycetota bacterium]|nr:WS/DGAT domain-containing protein [Actinomycetota bacterium]